MAAERIAAHLAIRLDYPARSVSYRRQELQWQSEQ